MSIDELFSIRNMYWCGSYRSAVEEALEIDLDNKSLEPEKRLYLLRSYLALGEPGKVVEQVGETEADESIRAIAFQAMQQLRPDLRETIQAQVQGDLSGSSNAMLQLVAATLAYSSGDVKHAAELLSPPRSLEAMGVLLQVFLDLNKLDSARQVLSQMIQTDEDSALTHIANSLMILFERGSKLSSVLYVTQDLMDKFGASPKLLNLQAATHMALEQFEEAAPILVRAQEESPADLTIQANYIACLCHLNYPQSAIQEQCRKLLELSAGAPAPHPSTELLQRFLSSYEAGKGLYAAAPSA